MKERPPMRGALGGGGSLLSAFLLALPPKAKDIVFRFIIEYSSLRDFYRPLGNIISLFSYEDF
jgi:hypothetical protein